MNRTDAFLFAALLILPLASAANADASNPALLQAAFADAQCRVTFTNSVITSVTTRVPGVPNYDALLADVAALNSDITFLQGYVTNNDLEGFKAYVNGTFRSHLTAANQDVKDARASFQSINVTREVLEGLRSDYNASKAAYGTCHLGAIKQYALAKAARYDEMLANATATANKLGEKGVDTSGMMVEVNNANELLVGPFKIAIDSATTPEQVKAALQKFCLFNGCPNGLNFHFAANFEVQKASAIYDALVEHGASGPFVEKTKIDLASVKSTLALIGTKWSSKAQQEVLWAQIRLVYADLKALRKTIPVPSPPASSG